MSCHAQKGRRTAKYRPQRTRGMIYIFFARPLLAFTELLNLITLNQDARKGKLFAPEASPQLARETSLSSSQVNPSEVLFLPF